MIYNTSGGNMIEVIRTFYKPIQSAEARFLCMVGYTCYCEKCNAILKFKEQDINRDKILPHLHCFCGNVIQLPERFCISK